MPIYTDSFDSADSFWSNPISEPKRSFRFTFDVAGLPIWTITKVDRPSFKTTSLEHRFYNHTFNYPGRLTWDPITFETVDPISPDATGILLKMIYASGYEYPDKQFGGDGYNYRSINKVDAIDALNPVTITAYDGQGTSIEKWTLKNAFIESVGNGAFDYGQEELIRISVTLKYDWATLEKLNGRAPLQTGVQNPPVPDAAVGP